MKKLLFSLLLMPFLCIAQIQIGQDLDGESFMDASYVASLSLDGSILAIGASFNDNSGENSGYVRIFENQNGTWTQIGDEINGQEENSNLGFSVSLNSSGDIVAISSLADTAGDTLLGKVGIYGFQGGVWTQIGENIDGEMLGDTFGHNVSLNSSGDIVAIAAPENGGASGKGYVKIYKNQGGIWTLLGNKIVGDADNDNSGVGLSLNSSGNIVAIGAPNNDTNGDASGHVKIYENQGGVWAQIGNDIIGEEQGDNAGWNLSLNNSGNIVAIGAIGASLGSGSVSIYENQGGVWTQIGNNIIGEEQGDVSGWSLSLNNSGNIVAIGAPANDADGSFKGHTRIYKNQGGVWSQIGEDINGETSGDGSGRIVSLSQDGITVAIGSPAAINEFGDAAGHVRVYDLSNILSTNTFLINQFTLYPNPAKAQFTIQLKDTLQLEEVIIYNNLGQFVSMSKDTAINTSHLTPGIYFVEVKTNKGVSSQKLIIE